MKNIRKNILCMFFLSTFSVQETELILPETIATVTLLKCGGVAIAGIIGRYVVLGAKNTIETFQIRMDRYPSLDSCGDIESDKNEVRVANDSKIVGLVKIKDDLLQKVKNSIFTDRQKADLNDQKKEANAQTWGMAHDTKTAYSWSQSNIHAQQARGFLPKINNYYYHSSKEDFWKGIAIGSFLTGTTSFYLVLKIKKD
ncbi:hypothetical protein HYV10_00580 [Candidatus Dependentiae bacterium]|nr:hypothetical protein [Candidatus Dependentiae bacterium]